MAIAQSVIVDKFQDSAIRTKYIGYAYSAASLGYIIGPLLGGGFGSLFGYSGAFWIAALLVLCLSIWVGYSFNDTHIPDRNKAINILQAISAIKSIFNKPKLYRIYLTNFLIFFAVMGLYRVVPLFVEDNWHPSLSLYSTIIAYVSLLCCLANLFIIGQLAKRLTNQKLLAALLIIGGLLVILIPVPQKFYWIWLTYGAAVIPTVMALPTCTTWLSHHALAPDTMYKEIKENKEVYVLQ
ncbi:MAG: transporter, family, multidrug resistance protein [Pseudomonadota bacterium]|nr:transporter, family, multidrug resistance protein [Pseudomonadota bacterium]